MKMAYCSAHNVISHCLKKRSKGSRLRHENFDKDKQRKRKN